MRLSRTSSGSAPHFRTSSLNLRISNFGPSYYFAFSRKERISIDRFCTPMPETVLRCNDRFRFVPWARRCQNCYGNNLPLVGVSNVWNVIQYPRQAGWRAQIIFIVTVQAIRVLKQSDFYTHLLSKAPSPPRKPPRKRAGEISAGTVTPAQQRLACGVRERLRDMP
jgi:hypothetical protein